MTKTIKQTVTFLADPQTVYNALMDSKIHSKFTGGTAKISGNVGGKFSVYDGYAEGKNLELISGKKIVQSWRASDWPEGHLSTVTFDLKKVGKNTKLTFSHKNVPADQVTSIKKGWLDYYWQPMKEMFASQK